MPRHSRQGSDDSPGQLVQDVCQCHECSCQCACRRQQYDWSDMDNEYTLVNSDTDSVTSEEPEDINQPDREPTPGLQALEAEARHLGPLLRYPHAATPQFVRDEATLAEFLQLLAEMERLRRSSQPSSMESSFVSEVPQYDEYDYATMQGSMMVQPSSRSPFSSMDSSMYVSFTSSRQSSNSPGFLFRSNSSAVLEGIGGIFEQSNWFITSPLKLNAEPESCLPLSPPTRSLSLPAIKIDQPLDSGEVSI